MNAGTEEMTNIDLFSPISLGGLTLPNRMVMAPLTRNRAAMPGNVPQAMNVTYYAQRSSAGLIISEATQVSPEGVGYPQALLRYGEVLATVGRQYIASTRRYRGDAPFFTDKMPGNFESIGLIAELAGLAKHFPQRGGHVGGLEVVHHVVERQCARARPV